MLWTRIGLKYLNKSMDGRVAGENWVVMGVK